MSQTLSQTMNKVGAAASSAGSYMYIQVYTYIRLSCTSNAYVYLYYVSIIVKGAFVRATKPKF
jgi:hypothetical protein